jgi:uncharacterized protein (DUF1330 family)
MAVYLIVNVDVKDPSTYEQYKADVPALIRKHGGEYLVRGGTFQVIEGNWQPSRLVLLRFPDKESALAFFNDPEYKPLKELRQRVTETDIVMVEGA